MYLSFDVNHDWFQESLSPALERSVLYFTFLLGEMMWLSGRCIVPHAILFKKVITAVLDVPSYKVCCLLRRLFSFDAL